jgi:hypothetical protein
MPIIGFRPLIIPQNGHPPAREKEMTPISTPDKKN